PKPFTSVTVTPCTPISDSAERTSSSLKGLITAVTSFIGFSGFYRGQQGHQQTLRRHRPHVERHQFAPSAPLSQAVPLISRQGLDGAPCWPRSTRWKNRGRKKGPE